MKVFIVHYHLNPGGVTRIIDLQIEALKLANPRIKIVIITGHCPDSSPLKNKGVEVIVNPDFNYLQNINEPMDEVYQRILTFFKKSCSRNDLIHIHNPNLGKNPLVTLAISQLAKDGYYILNHAHDFSEDRTENQHLVENVIEGFFNQNAQEVMYPGVKNYYFSVLNSFDYNRLIGYGVNKSNCFILPNPVSLSPSTSSEGDVQDRYEVIEKLKLDKSKLIVTYPVRVIKRKNIAEFILLATVFKETANWVVTQPPKNPVEVAEYNKWKEFCKLENIPVCWEAGNKVEFEKLIAVSDYCITTSIKEGFGMVYLEPWLLKTPVIGRDLPTVTGDFKSAGISFPFLYQQLFVEAKKEIQELRTDEQMELIRNIIKIPNKRNALLELNPFLKKFPVKIPEVLIQKNKEVILREYSLEKYGKRLDEIYRIITKQS